MARNAIYFPYINVPANSWLLRMALYWDHLSSIVPSEYLSHPEWLKADMRDLVHSELIQQIVPGMYLPGFHDFHSPFLEYAMRWRQSRGGDVGRRFSRVHIEKLGSLSTELQARHLATDDGYPWVRMPTPLANAFMAYLAGLLGQLDDLDAAPITNSNPMGMSLAATSKDALRDALIKELLPMPAACEQLTIDEVLAFKKHHGEGAARLRDRLEQECVLIGVSPPELRAQQFDALKNKLQTEIEETTEAMRVSWKSVAFGTVLPILAGALPLLDADWHRQAATAVGSVGSVGAAVYQAAQTLAAARAARGRPLAYVALARRRFG